MSKTIAFLLLIVALVAVVPTCSESTESGSDFDESSGEDDVLQSEGPETKAEAIEFGLKQVEAKVEACQKKYSVDDPASIFIIFRCSEMVLKPFRVLNERLTNNLKTRRLTDDVDQILLRYNIQQAKASITLRDCAKNLKGARTNAVAQRVLKCVNRSLLIS